MRQLPRIFLLSTLVTLVGACSLFGGSGGTDGSVGSSSSESTVTRNVSYRGMLRELGVSIYMQGTHQLELSDGSMVILVSTDASLDLDTYNGRNVEVRGSVQPTVEAGGTLMRVEEVTVLDASSASSSAAAVAERKFCGGIAALPCDTGEICVDDLTDSCDPNAGGADCGGICVPGGVESSSSSSSPAPVSSSSRPTVQSSARMSQPSVASSSVPSSIPSGSASDAEAELMAKQNYSSPFWVQEYCTGHIGFCIPVHRNWYYKSFGATTSNLWHVEFGMTSPETLGQGVIVLNVVSGSSASAGAQSGQIKAQGGDIVAYRDFEGDHFEIAGPASLREAISYMVNNITPYQAE